PILGACGAAGSRLAPPQRARIRPEAHHGDKKPMNSVTLPSPLSAGPAVVSAAALKTSIKVEPLTCTIGAELRNVHLGAASRDPGLMAELRGLLLKHKVLFFRDQDITRAEHVAFARCFGELED